MISVNDILRPNFFRLTNYWIWHCFFGFPYNYVPMPLSLTISVTNKCVSKCRTCNIWKIYHDNPGLSDSELSANEWKAVLKSIGKSPFWVTISGGNQFLCKDLIGIIESVIEHCLPIVINIPVSGMYPDLVYSAAKTIAKACSKKGIRLIMNISIDDIKNRQDDVRGVKGDFDNTMETYKKLIRIKSYYNKFYLGVYTVISAYNVDNIPAVCDFVKKCLKPDTYALEIAEHRTELCNTTEDIIPDMDKYEKAMKYYRNLFTGNESGLLFFKNMLRNLYYDYISSNKKIKCRAGIVSAQISPYGDIWPCCTKAETMGNLKDAGYDFKNIWYSNKAYLIRNKIKETMCSCTHCNPFYTNALFDPKGVIRLFYEKRYYIGKAK